MVHNRNKLPGIASLLLQAADADASHMGASAPPSGMGYRCDMPVGSIKEQGSAVREMSYQGNFPLGCPKSVHTLIIPLPQQALAQISGNSLSKAGMMILPGKNSMSRIKPCRPKAGIIFRYIFRSISPAYAQIKAVQTRTAADSAQTAGKAMPQAAAIFVQGREGIPQHPLFIMGDRIIRGRENPVIDINAMFMHKVRLSFYGR